MVHMEPLVGAEVQSNSGPGKAVSQPHRGLTPPFWVDFSRDPSMHPDRPREVRGPGREVPMPTKQKRPRIQVPVGTVLTHRRRDGDVVKATVTEGGVRMGGKDHRSANAAAM